MKNEYLLGLAEGFIFEHLVTPPDINIYQKVSVIHPFLHAERGQDTHSEFVCKEPVSFSTLTFS